MDVTGRSLPTAHMQSIAREFNFSETVFLQTRGAAEAARVNIFTPVNEMDFAGHPIIGTGHVLFRQLLPKRPSSLSKAHDDSLVIETNAGDVAITYNREAQVVSAQVPHNVHIHSQATPTRNILSTQPAIAGSNAVTALEDTYPAVSVVKGVTYTLVDLTTLPEVFNMVAIGASPVTPLDAGWAPSFTGTMYYQASAPEVQCGRKVQRLRVRMIAINLEDPACGSGSCALGAFLALRDGAGHGKYTFHLDQGSEMGRDSHISVDIELDETGGKILSMTLSGQAAPVTEGVILLPE